MLTPGFLLALPFAFAAAAPADRELCRAGFLQLLSPDAQSVSADQCRRVAQQAMAAWRFDAERMQWVQPAEMERPLTMRLLSVARMKTEHAGLLGFARGRDLFVVSTAVLDDPFANGTVAHELGHIQAKRALGKHSEEHLVPRYFLEGHGNALGRAYRDFLHVTRHDYDVRKARDILSFSGDEATLIFTDNSYAEGDRAKEGRMESMGVFFVEYLRVRLHRTGVPDTLPRMGRIFEKVGRGETYEAAFREEFGVSLDRVISDIAGFIRQTASNPAGRLRGTHYEQFR